jgi:hypothetical protein
MNERSIRYHGVDGSVPRGIPHVGRVHPEGEPLEGSIGRGLFFGVLGSALCLAVIYGLVLTAQRYPEFTIAALALMVIAGVYRRARRWDKEHGLG